jgi:hypothetical protein
MTAEEALIQRYFDAFNRHDIEGVMACFHGDPMLIGPNGKRCTGSADCGGRTRASSPRFPTGAAICACAPAIAAAAWRSRFSMAPVHIAA